MTFWLFFSLHGTASLLSKMSYHKNRKNTFGIILFVSDCVFVAAAWTNQILSWSLVATHTSFIGGRFNSVDPSSTINLRPWVRFPRTTSALFQFKLELWWEKDEKIKKRPGLENILPHLLRIVIDPESIEDYRVHI